MRTAADLGELVNLLAVGINHSAIYFRGHPRVVESAGLFARRLKDTVEHLGQESLFLGVVDGRLVYEGKPLIGPTLMARRLVDAAVHLRSGGFLFQQGATADEMQTYFAVCSDPKKDVRTLDDARRLFASSGIHHVALSPVYGDPGWLGNAAGGAGEGAVPAATLDAALDAMVPVYQSLLGTVEGLHAGAHDSRELDVAGSRTGAESVLLSLEDRPSDLLHLSRYPDYDSYTVGHSVRVALLAVLVGRAMGFDRRLLVEMGTAGLLHDVGKGKIPHEILFKRGRLDDDERRVMSRHPVLGVEALLQTRDAAPVSLAAAFGHHLRHDRRGYPPVGGWAHSSRLTALVQVCDVFEALTAVRPYKPSLAPRRAYEIMLQDPGVFDPVALTAFVRAVGLYPPGCRVRLTSGEQALVLRAGKRISRPDLLVTHDAVGAPLALSDRRTVELEKVPPRALAVEEVLLEAEREVNADPADYEDRPLTVVLRDCGHVHQ